MNNTQLESSPNADEGVAIQMIGVHKWYGQFHVLKDINLSVDRQEKIVICGLRARASRR